MRRCRDCEFRQIRPYGTQGLFHLECIILKAFPPEYCVISDETYNKYQKKYQELYGR